MLLTESTMFECTYQVRMAEWSKALRSGRSRVLQAWVRIPVLTKLFCLPRRLGQGIETSRYDYNSINVIEVSRAL